MSRSRYRFLFFFLGGNYGHLARVVCVASNPSADRERNEYSLRRQLEHLPLGTFDMRYRGGVEDSDIKSSTNPRDILYRCWFQPFRLPNLSRLCPWLLYCFRYSFFACVSSPPPTTRVSFHTATERFLTHLGYVYRMTTARVKGDEVM